MAMGAFGKDFGDGADSFTKFKERWIEKINTEKDKVFYASAALVRKQGDKQSLPPQRMSTGTRGVAACQHSGVTVVAQW